VSASKSASVAVVVLNYNGLDDTLKCLASLRAVQYPLLSVHLVDNGSAVDPTAAALSAYPGLRVLKTGTNLGYAGGNNRGIEAVLGTATDYVLVLNNDTVVDPSIIEALVQAFATDSRLGIVGPTINFMDEPHAVMTDGVQFNPGLGVDFFHRIEVPLNQPEAPLVDVDIVNGCCMMIRADVLRAVGGLDESMFIVHEESDLCLRAKLKGFRCAVLGRTLVWHKGSSSFERSGRQLQRYFDTRNLFYLLRRYSGRVPGSRSVRNSLWYYFRYVSYRYEHEREAKKDAAALAVVDGLRDALAGVTGPYTFRQRRGATTLRMILSTLQQISRVKARLFSRR